MIKKTRWILMIIAFLCAAGCGHQQKKTKTLNLQGAWTLEKVVYPAGFEQTYPVNGSTQCLVYDADSIYKCRLMTSAGATAIIPWDAVNYTLIDKGDGEYVYLEEQDPHPLHVLTDSTITIQTHGRVYTWKRASEMTESRMEEIRTTIANNLDDEMTRFVLSTTEKELKATNHTLIYLLIGIVLALAVTAWTTFRWRQRNKYLERQLKDIKEERELRPQPVQHAMEEVEKAFVESDDYQNLRRRITRGERLTDADWSDMEERMKAVYPGFSNHLYSLYDMSEQEYRVCLLLKLRVPPSEIATVMIKDVSTISSMRSRLYRKVFNRKGGAKDWDEFIASL